jgi:hypothetical protein
VMAENSRCSIWGEMRTSAGTWKLARAKHWPMGLRPAGYVAAASCTV